MLQVVALWMSLHDRVDAAPEPMLDGVAVKLPIVVAGLRTATLQVADVPRVTVTAYVPAVEYVVEKVLTSPPLAGAPPGADHAKLA